MILYLISKKMKKLLFSIIIMSIVSCSKDESCNCGTIKNDGVDIANNCHWIEIENECSGNRKSFCIDEDIWWDANPGENFCITNIDSW